jgi:hypothetical protein
MRNVHLTSGYHLGVNLFRTHAQLSGALPTPVVRNCPDLFSYGIVTVGLSPPRQPPSPTLTRS